VTDSKVKPVALISFLALGACLDLSADGKRFACPGCPIDQELECSCAVPPPVCNGDSVVVAGAPLCLADGGCGFSLETTQCPSGCSDARCTGSRCLGIRCDAPPAATCLSAQALRGFVPQGTCEDGQCSYAHVDVSCSCVNGRCLDNPCAGKHCNVPPAPVCMGDLLRTFLTAGVCDGATGRCIYTHVDTSCGAAGCANGQCRSCDATTCSGGCCDSDGRCVAAASQSAGTCGTGGAACIACGSGLQCTGGQCVPACVPESDAAFCSRLGKTCGSVTAADNCGASRTASCGACPAGQSCSGSNVCVFGPVEVCNDAVDNDGDALADCADPDCAASPACCAPESNAVFCSRLAKNCGSVTAADNCGMSRTASCGTCSAGQACSGANVCVANPEQACGDGIDNDGDGSIDCADTDCATRSCGTGCNCSGGARHETVCNDGIDNDADAAADCSDADCAGTAACMCTPETNAAFCSRLGKNCGTVTAADNCMTTRSVSCGTCTAPQTCGATNVCACMPESNAAFCSRLGKTCGAVTAADNCGTTRTVSSCGTCTAGQTCGATNVCVTPPRMVFSSAWQALPNTGATVIEFRCLGTITGNGTTSTRCGGGDDVQVRINGSTYTLYPGCTGNRNNCVYTVPSSGFYKDDDDGAGGRLLCEAMGWTRANSLTDQNAGTVDRAVAVVQTGPLIYGTDSAQRNWASYVDCRP